jgi:hypothetical protein
MTDAIILSYSRTITMKPYRYTRGRCEQLGETFNISDRDGVEIVSVEFWGGADVAEATARLIVSALDAYDGAEDSRMTDSGPYDYSRDKDGCDEVFNVVDGRGQVIVSVRFWDEVEAAEAKARLLVGALNAYAESQPSAETGRLVNREPHLRGQSVIDEENS